MVYVGLPLIWPHKLTGTLAGAAVLSVRIDQAGATRGRPNCKGRRRPLLPRSTGERVLNEIVGADRKEGRPRRRN